MNQVQTIGLEVDVLFDLQLQVARKADELVRAQRIDGHLNLHCWLVAESEVLGRGERGLVGTRIESPRPVG